MSTEPRRWQRIAADIPVTLLLGRRAELFKYRCLGVDVSPGGLRVRSHLALEPGLTLKVIPFMLSNGSPYVVRSRVVWAGGPGSGLEGQLGLAFLEPSRRRFLV